MKPTQYNFTVFEDNIGALELVKTPKSHPRSKHINVKYHHFRKFVSDGTIELKSISTEEEQEYMLKNPLSKSPFNKFRKLVMGWSQTDVLCKNKYIKIIISM